MSIVADKMKDNINSITSIKTKLVRNSIWDADKISECLSKNKDIEKINISDNKDRLYLHMKDGKGPQNNNLEIGVYNKISNYTEKMIKGNIGNLLDDREKQYIKEYGLNKTLNMMYHLAPLANQRLIVMDL